MQWQLFCELLWIWQNCGLGCKTKITTKSDDQSSLQPYNNCCWNCYRNSYYSSNLIWSKHWRNCSFTFCLDFRFMHPRLDWGKCHFLTNLIHGLRTQNEEISLNVALNKRCTLSVLVVSCLLINHMIHVKLRQKKPFLKA